LYISLTALIHKRKEKKRKEKKRKEKKRKDYFPNSIIKNNKV